MAEEITQVLGFDAGQAIAEIDKLDRKLKDLQSTISSFGTSLSTFNKRAGRTVAALKQMAQAAGNARRALGTGFAQATAVGPTGQQVQAVVNLGNSAKTAQARLQAVGQAGQTMGQQVASGTRKAQAGAQSLNVSFQTMARIISTQLIVRALGGLQRALTDSVSAAFEFQEVVAEIQTIDPRGGGQANFGEIADEVRELSDAFNADLGDVGRGLYQTISNQIARAGDASQRAATNYQFLSTAIQLSRAGVATVEQSVNLLAGTINAFGEDVDSAAQISGQFFRVVELGRTTIRELATSFNTVTPLASQLGVSIEELGAAFATITIGGVDTAKAATQIRGTLNALLKPTTEMKRAFEDLGVTTGEQLIDLFGFQGALEAVIGTTDGSSQAIAKLIPRVRGLTGVLRLVGSGADNFRENLQKIIDTNSELLQQKFDIIVDTNAFQVEKEFRQLRNFLVDDFGNSVVEVTKNVLDFAGGMDNVIQVIQAVGAGAKIAVPAMAAIGVAMLALGVQAKIASANVGLLNKALLAVVAVGAAISVGQFLGTQINDFLRREIDERNDAREAELDRIDKDAKKRLEIEESTNKLIIADFKSSMAEIAKINASRISEARKTAQQIRDANKGAFEGVLGASETLEKRLRSQFESREGQARESIGNVRDLEGDLRDERFRQQTRGLSDTKRFFALESRLRDARQRAIQAARQQATRSADPEAVERTREAFREVSQAAADLQNQAQQTGDQRQVRRADRAAIESIQTRIQLERQLQRVIASRRAAEKAAADAVAENNRKLKDSLKELVESQDGLFEQGISDEEQNRRFEQFKKSRLGFFELLQKNAQIGARELADFSRVFGERGFAGIVQDELTRSEINQLVISETALKKAKDDLEAALAGAVADVNVNIRVALEGAGFGVGSQADVSRGVQEAFATDEAVKAAEIEVQRIQERIQRLVQDLPSIREEVQNRLASRERAREARTEQFGAEPVGSDLQRALAAFQREALTTLSGGEVDTTQLEKLQGLLQNIQTEFGKFGFLRREALEFQFANDINQIGELGRLLGTAATETERLAEARQQLEETQGQGAFSNAEQRQAIIDAVQQEAARTTEDAAQTKEEVIGTGTAGQQAANQLSLMTDSINDTRNAVAALQTDLNNLQAPNVGPVTAATGGLIQGFAKGGLVKYLDRGGFLPRGTDTIPAMLSPGEFVVNARSARRFYSELSAINSGVRPVYRQDGGPVSNTSIGDINVTVQPGRSSESTGREIGRSLRRELRRNTSTL